MDWPVPGFPPFQPTDEGPVWTDNMCFKDRDSLPYTASYSGGHGGLWQGSRGHCGQEAGACPEQVEGQPTCRRPVTQSHSRSLFLLLCQALNSVASQPSWVFFFPFEVFKSMCFSTLTNMCNHHHYLVPEHSITPKRNPYPLTVTLQFPSPAPDNC